MSLLSISSRRVGGFLLAAMIGCSASEKSATLSPSDTGTPFQSGQLSGSVIGPLSAPMTTTSAGTTINGLVGQFTSLVFDPGGSPVDPLGATPLFFIAIRNGAFDIWRINLDGSNARQITTDSVFKYAPAIDPASGRLAFYQHVIENGFTYYSIYSMKQDGSDKKLLLGPASCVGLRLEWAPSGNVLYNDLCGDPYLREIGFGPITRAEFFSVVNSSAGQFALIARESIFGNTAGGIFRVNYPSRDTSVVLLGDTSNVYGQPEASRVEPIRLAYWRWAAPDSVWKLNVGLLSDPANTRVIRTAPHYPYSYLPCVRWAPDGNHLIMGSEGFEIESQLVLVDTLGKVVRQITHQPGGASACPGIGNPDSSMAGGNGPVALIGDGGLLGASASGIITSQGPQADLAAMVAFRARNQRSVELEAGTGLNSTAPVLTYTLAADRLTALAYTSFPAADSAVQAIDSTSPASGALITFDAATGAVALILPYSSANNPQAPQISDASDSRVFQGTFLAAYDRAGRNLAPGGATQAVLDLKTGVVRVNR